MKISNITSDQLLNTKLEPKEKGHEDSVSQFSNLLESSIEKLNDKLQTAEKLAIDLASGKDVDLPMVMTEINKADLSFRMFLQIRNKALSAYEEIMRLQF